MANCLTCIHYHVCLKHEECGYYEPDRPHGEWEKYGDKIEAYDIAGHKTWGQKRRCTKCHFIVTYIEDFGFYSICPNCGAAMRTKESKPEKSGPCMTCTCIDDITGRCLVGHYCEEYIHWKEGKDK